MKKHKSLFTAHPCKTLRNPRGTRTETRETRGFKPLTFEDSHKKIYAPEIAFLRTMHLTSEERSVKNAVELQFATGQSLTRRQKRLLRSMKHKHDYDKTILARPQGLNVEPLIEILEKLKGFNLTQTTELISSIVMMLEASRTTVGSMAVAVNLCTKVLQIDSVCAPSLSKIMTYLFTRAGAIFTDDEEVAKPQNLPEDIASAFAKVTEASFLVKGVEFGDGIIGSFSKRIHTLSMSIRDITSLGAFFSVLWEEVTNLWNKYFYGTLPAAERREKLASLILSEYHELSSAPSSKHDLSWAERVKSVNLLIDEYEISAVKTKEKAWSAERAQNMVLSRAQSWFRTTLRMASIITADTKPRQEPAAILWTGKPGLGKSGLMQLFSFLITRDFFPEESEASIRGRIYPRPQGERMDGIQSTTAAIEYDDSFQNSDSLVRGQMAVEIIQLVSIIKFFPDMAELSQKHAIDVRPLLVQATTNLPISGATNLGITDVTAFVRRFTNVVVEHKSHLTYAQAKEEIRKISPIVDPLKVDDILTFRIESYFGSDGAFEVSCMQLLGLIKGRIEENCLKMQSSQNVPAINIPVVNIKDMASTDPVLRNAIIGSRKFDWTRLFAEAGYLLTEDGKKAVQYAMDSTDPFEVLDIVEICEGVVLSCNKKSISKLFQVKMIDGVVTLGARTYKLKEGLFVRFVAKPQGREDHLWTGFTTQQQYFDYDWQLSDCLCDRDRHMFETNTKREFAMRMAVLYLLGPPTFGTETESSSEDPSFPDTDSDSEDPPIFLRTNVVIPKPDRPLPPRQTKIYKRIMNAYKLAKADVSTRALSLKDATKVAVSKAVGKIKSAVPDPLTPVEQYDLNGYVARSTGTPTFAKMHWKMINVYSLFYFISYIVLFFSVSLPGFFAGSAVLTVVGSFSFCSQLVSMMIVRATAWFIIRKAKNLRSSVVLVFDGLMMTGAMVFAILASREVLRYIMPTSFAPKSIKGESQNTYKADEDQSEKKPKTVKLFKVLQGGPSIKARPQGKDIEMEQTRLNVAFHNQFTINSLDGKHLIRALGIGDGYFITTRHEWQQISDKQCSLCHGNKEHTFYTPDIDTWIHVEGEIQSEFILVNLGINTRNIVKKFRYSADYEEGQMYNATVTCLEKVDGKLVVQIKQIARAYVNHNSVRIEHPGSPNKTKPYSRSIHGTMLGQGETADGDCSQPWFLEDSSCPRKIAGIHVASCGNDTPICAIVYRDFLEQVMYQNTPSLPPIESVEKFVKLLGAEQPPAHFQNTVGVGHLRRKYAPFKNPSTHFLRTDIPMPVTRKLPALVSLKDHEPEVIAYHAAKYDVVTLCPPSFKITTSALIPELVPVARDLDGPLDSMRHVVNGDKRLDVSAINLKAGKGLIAGRTWPGNGKFPCLRKDASGKVLLSTKYSSFYTSWEYEMEQGNIQPFITNLSYKDELLPASKVAVYKTRLFMPGPLDYHLLGSRLLGHFFAKLNSGKYLPWYGPGIDLTGRGSHYMRNYLKSNDSDPKRTIALDVKGMDVSPHDRSQIAVYNQMYTVMEMVFSDHPDWIQWKKLYHSWNTGMRHGFWCFGSFMMYVNGLIASGGRFTAEFNTLLLKCYIFHCFAIHYASIAEAAESWNVHIRAFFYGDDMVITIRNKCCKWFDSAYVEKTMKSSFNITMTMPDKNPVITDLHFDDVKLLQRSFVMVDGFWHAVRDVEDIMEGMYYWKNNGDTVQVAMLAKTHSMLLELSLHGEEVYTTQKAILDKNLARAGYPVLMNDYETYRIRYLKATG
jgi:hypothetical protein